LVNKCDIFKVHDTCTFFVPCSVTQLCNINQQNAYFANVLIQFCVSSTCFEHLRADEHMMFET